MANEMFSTALDASREINITVTGRNSGREISLPVWFVHDDEHMWLIPVHGSDSNWYKNELANPSIHVSANGAELDAHTTALTDSAKVNRVVDRFRAKYGDKTFDDYYPKHDVAIEVPLSSAAS
jgi:deazaflavin-dependent oxidoreductase (nitroreductase family)